MESEPRCEAPPVARSARSVLLYVSTHRSKRWRIAPWLRLQALLFELAAHVAGTNLAAQLLEVVHVGASPAQIVDTLGQRYIQA